MSNELTTIDDLKPAPYNPRKITDDNAQALGVSLMKFGDLSGIVWNQVTGHVVCGHQRIDQLKGMGAEFVPGDKPYFRTDKGDFPVRVVTMSEAEERAANLTANNRHISGEYTDDVISQLKLSSEEIGGELFQSLNLDALVDEQRLLLKHVEFDARVGGQVDEDEVPEPPENPVCNRGDIWKLGDHVVHCADAQSLKQRMLSPDCVFTDPPYGVSYQSRTTKEGVKNDDLRGQDLVQLVRDCVPASRVAYVCASWEAIPDFFEALGRPTSCCVWDKGHFGMGGNYRRQYELVLFYGKTGRKDLSDVWGFSREREYKHPTQKPVALPHKALVDCDAKDVYDPFLGSGTTLIAAEKLGVVCTGVEIDPRYCDVVIERWENLTGGKAKRA